MTEASTFFSELKSAWEYIADDSLNSPVIGILIILSLAIYALMSCCSSYDFKQYKKRKPYIPFPQQNLNLQQALAQAKRQMNDQKLKALLIEQLQNSNKNVNKQSKKGKQSSIKPKEYYKRFQDFKKKSLIYQTLSEKKAIQDRKTQIERKKKEELDLQLKAEREKERLKRIQNQQMIAKNQSQQSLRSSKRKTTIQNTLEEGEDQIIPKDNEIHSAGTTQNVQQNKNNLLSSQTTPFFRPKQQNKLENKLPLNSPSQTGNSLFSINKFPTQVKVEQIKPEIKSNNIQTKEEEKSSAANLIMSFGPTTQPKKMEDKKPIPKSEQPIPRQIVSNPPFISPVAPIAPSIIAPIAPLRNRMNSNLTSEEYFQILIKYAESQVASVQIPTIMANLGGAKSSLNDLLIFSKSFLDSINKSDNNQLTTFAVKLYDGIVRQISTSNLKDGIYRIPPKSKTDQVQKNSINCYILYINLYRMMGYEKIWIIVFGKLLKLLEFIYKRKEDLKHYSELDLLANKHLEKRGDIEGKYLSRIDYLTYMLFGLTAYDPVMIFRQTEQKERDLKQSRQEIQSLRRQWSYKQFWILVDLILKNKHDSYFKPILYMNFLSVLYPKIYEHKQDPSQFKAENQLYKLLLDEGKKYFSQFKANKELKILNVSDSREGVFNYDGDNFVEGGIKVLNTRLGVEKVKEFNLNARQFEAKSNVFYYFCKQK